MQSQKEAWPSLTLVQIGFVATCMLLGMSAGGYVFGPLADKYGRKGALVWCIAFFGITIGFTGFVTDYIQLAAFRFLAGLRTWCGIRFLHRKAQERIS